MARLTITTDDGEVLEIVDLNDYDLSKSMAQADLMDTIRQAVKVDKQRKEAEKND